MKETKCAKFHNTCHYSSPEYPLPSILLHNKQVKVSLTFREYCTHVLSRSTLVQYASPHITINQLNYCLHSHYTGNIAPKHCLWLNNMQLVELCYGLINLVLPLPTAVPPTGVLLQECLNSSEQLWRAGCRGRRQPLLFPHWHWTPMKRKPWDLVSHSSFTLVSILGGIHWIDMYCCRALFKGCLWITACKDTYLR